MTSYSLPSDRAYLEKLQVLKAGQRWFAFDVPMDMARKAKAKRFGMTIWNFHCIDGSREFERWGITKDLRTGEYWYRVAKERGGVTSINRQSLWDALHIVKAMPTPFPARAILKDGKTHRCSPDHVFDITDIRLQEDGSALWLKLGVPMTGIGTGCDEVALPEMHALDSSGPPRKSGGGVLPDEHYLAIRDAAVRTYLQGSVRARELESLNATYGINKDTASANFNNFRCLIAGDTFKAPMRAFGLQLFVDAVVARFGEEVVPKVIQAIEGYVHYARTSLKQNSPGFDAILNELKKEAAQAKAVQELLTTGALPPASGYSGSAEPAEAQRLATTASELLREVWVRGPQHAAFRRALQRRWSDKCAVHGVACNDQLRASHIVGWSLDEALRGDVNNGLLLSVPLDNLFDRGLISFDDAGAIILSNKLTPDTCKHFGVHPGLRVAWDHLSESDRAALRATLARHRAQHSL